MRVKDLPEAERPRERLFRLGPEALSDRELLALQTVGLRFLDHVIVTETAWTRVP